MMYDDIPKYLEPQTAAQEVLGAPTQRSIKDNLLKEKANHEKRLKQVDRALELLDKYPEIQELMNLL